MKRATVANHLNHMAEWFDFCADAQEQNDNNPAAEAYRHAARITRREAYKIKEKL